jgi:PAS domain S-box-containing protein
MASQKSLFKLVDLPPLSWLVPDHLQDSNTLDEQRARLLVLAAAFLCVVQLVFGLVFWMQEAVWLTAVVFVGALTTCAPCLLLRRIQSFGVAGNLFAFQAHLTLCVVIALNGGPRPELLAWMLIPPMIAVVFAGTWSGIAWMATSIAACVVFVVLATLGVTFPQAVADNPFMISVGGPATLITLSSLGLLLHARLQRWLVESLEQAQKEALDASHRSFRTLIEHSPDAIVVLRRQGPPVYLNPAASEMLGYTEEELMELDPSKMIPADELEDLRRLRAKLDDETLVDIELESTRTRKDGSEIDVEVRQFFTAFKGEPALFVSMRDISERKQMQAQMMRMDRMIAVGTLAAGVAHEINNPLAFVTGNATLLQTEFAQGAFDSWTPPEDSALDHDELREVIEDVTEGAERIRRIVSGLHSFARDGHDDVESTSVDVNDLLESVLKMAQHEIKHRARLVTDLEDLPPVKGDNAGLGQVFLNLVINAAHAIPSGNRNDHQITVHARQRDDSVYVTVSDTGSGIPDEVKSRIFDPFFTTKSHDDGMGLGLYITQSIVRDHGGELTFETTLGEGTSFRVRLPVTTQEPADLSGPLPVVQDHEVSARLLIVDDEPNILRTLRRALSGFDVTTANSAEAAIEQLRHGERFDLILCDLLMPQMSGMKFFTYLEEEFEALSSQVIFMTGGTFTDEARSFVESSGRPVVEKPFDLAKLQEVLWEGVEGEGVEGEAVGV